MSKVEEIYNKMMVMKLSELLQTAALAIETKMDEKRKAIILMALESRLMKRSLLVKRNIELERFDDE